MEKKEQKNEKNNIFNEKLEISKKTINMIKSVIVILLIIAIIFIVIARIMKLDYKFCLDVLDNFIVAEITLITILCIIKVENKSKDKDKETKKVKKDYSKPKTVVIKGTTLQRVLVTVMIILILGVLIYSIISNIYKFPNALMEKIIQHASIIELILMALIIALDNNEKSQNEIVQNENKDK